MTIYSINYIFEGFQRMSKETIEKIAEEFVRQPQCVDEDISINFISKINPKPPTKIEYCMHLLSLILFILRVLMYYYMYP